MIVAGRRSHADLGSRTIREEIDAIQVLGIDPIHRLVLPQVFATRPGLPQVVIAEIKACLIEHIAALVACHMAFTGTGGTKGRRRRGQRNGGLRVHGLVRVECLRHHRRRQSDIGISR